MNFINKGFLQLALAPRGVYKRMGVNTRHLKAILIAKLTIDDRRPNTVHQAQRRKKDKPINAATLGTILVSALLGLLYLLAFTIGQDMITKLTFYFSFFFFMLAASLISDFTAVLIDVRDNYILLPKPVNDRTIVTARILHIFIHICKLVVPMCLPGLFFMGYTTGIWGGISFLFLILMVTLFTIFFINALYIIILKITSPQKFQTIISYVQIVFGIALYGSYQVLPRMMKDFVGISFSTGANPLFLFFPSYWFASGWNILQTLNGSVQEWIAAFIGYLLPVVSMYVVLKYLAPAFNNKLAMVTSSGGETVQKIAKEKKGKSYAGFLSRLFTNYGPERMGFLFTWKMSARSRDFRMKVYPSIGYIFVYVIIVMLQSKQLSLDEVRNQTNTGRILIISALYICSYLPITAITQAAFSEKFKAAWIFYTIPVSKPGLIIRGSTKASILSFFLPLAFVTTVAGFVIIGWQVLPNIVLGLINQILLSCIVVFTSHQQLPFSVHEGAQRKSGAFIRGLITLMASGFVGLLHFFIYNNTPVIIIFIALSFIATWLLMDSIKNISWQKMIRANEES